MRDRVALITGAKGGLGSFVTNAFLDAGAFVVGSSRSISQSDFPVATFSAESVDFTKPADVSKLVEKVVGKFGGLDILVHVLGGFSGGKTVAETDDATWEQMLNLNLNSAFYVLRAAIPHLRKSGHGRVIAIGSLAATVPHAGLAAYVTSKSALAMLVRSIAEENKDCGVTANVILPGTMDTPGNREAMPNADFSKWLQPQDVAKLVLWLADENAGHVTGAMIPIDAGNA
jgi:NAD(P)-dependent dehydrogenase (short-subunit alcohol dehydrogenase family)